MLQVRGHKSGASHSSVLIHTLKVEYSGAIYHVRDHGDQRTDLSGQYGSPVPRLRIETLAEACAKTGRQVHSYVLGPSHFRLVVEMSQPNLVACKLPGFR